MRAVGAPRSVTHAPSPVGLFRERRSRGARRRLGPILGRCHAPYPDEHAPPEACWPVTTLRPGLRAQAGYQLEVAGIRRSSGASEIPGSITRPRKARIAWM